MQLHLKICCAALAIVLTAGTIAFAGPPFTTDDPEPVPFHHGEAYLFSTGAISHDAAEGLGPGVEINYSVVRNSMFHLIVPLAFYAPRHGMSQFGYGDMELGIKYRFTRQSDFLPAIGIFPLLELPSGNAGKNLGSGETQAYFPLWLQKDIGKWTTYGGGGYWINPGQGNKNWVFTGLLVQYNFGDAFFLGMEILHETAQVQHASGDTRLQFGGGIPLARNTQILFSSNAGMDNNDSDEVTYYLGFYLTF